MDDRLRQAIRLAKNGQRDNAQNIVREMLKENPKNADAWFVAAYIMENRDRQIDALKHALAIDPNHQMAQAALDKLQPRTNDDIFFSELNPKSITSPNRDAKVSKSTAALLVVLAAFVSFAIIAIILIIAVVKSTSVNKPLAIQPTLSISATPPVTAKVDLIVGKWVYLAQDGQVSETLEFDNDGTFHEVSVVLKLFVGSNLARGQWKYTDSNHIRADVTYGNGGLDIIDFDIISLTPTNLKTKTTITSLLNCNPDPSKCYVDGDYTRSP